MTANQNRYDFAWGNPYFLLDVLSKMYPSVRATTNVGSLSYPPDEGIGEMVSVTKQVIYKTTGFSYQHVAMTAGATQALNSILKMYKLKGYDTVITSYNGYPYYEKMIEYSGLKRDARKIGFSLDTKFMSKSFILLDSPTNPEGDQFRLIKDGDQPIIWDNVYHNKIYSANPSVFPEHDMVVSSYSKLLGVTGARLGFLATNDKELFEQVLEVCNKDVATVSVPSQDLILDVLKTINIDEFLSKGSVHLSYNKEQFQRLEYLFENQPVPEVGMFYCVKPDQKALDILGGCGIKYVNIKDKYIRLSLGQYNDLTKEAVDQVLSKDKVRK